MNVRKTLAVAGSSLLAALFSLQAVPPVAAQEVVQDEGAFYRAFYDAAQAGDNAKALSAAREYLAKFPTGQYADNVKGALTKLEYELAIKEKRTGDAIRYGRELLPSEQESLRLPYQLAFIIRANELLASPANFDHIADAVEFSKKGIGLIEAGKTLEGAQSFNKDAALAWMFQILAIAEAKTGDSQEAVKLYEKSTALGLQTPQLVARNLLAVHSIRQAGYTQTVNELKALPDAEKKAAEPKPEVAAALDLYKQRADAFIESGTSFVAYSKVKDLAARTRDQVNEGLKQVYRDRFPDDADLAGLAKILQEKEASFAAPPTS